MLLLVISHGLPYPENLDLALSLEKIVRENQWYAYIHHCEILYVE